EDEMPDVKPPVPDASSIEELRALLVELAIPAETVNVILAGGFKTVTDLVATSPEQFASLTGLEARVAQEIHLAIQKRVWFGGI
ncbi:MAG: helix-hairpin-helix domain-containing protein, partial [Candidatus Thorarchaeota archaeon]